MPQLENDASRLKTLRHLLGEALLNADEINRAMIAAKISDCVDCVDLEIAAVSAELRSRSGG